jgi:hypothetical protein
VSARVQTWAATAFFVAVTVVMTWPQAALLATHARDHHDVFFNLWRFRWFVHALTTSPTSIFDGNIFYPERHPILYSDAMVVEGLCAAPLTLAGLPPVLVHNLLLLGAIVSSAVGMFVLTRHLTGSAGAGIVAGVIFAFVPYRFEHYMHMELQWTTWMPWAFWALHRTIETSKVKYGLLAGLFVSLQMLSSIYYGVFLVVLFALIAVVLLLGEPRGKLLSSSIALAPAALVVLVLCGAYSRPYLAAKEEVGGRGKPEISAFSARPSNYLVATPENRVYGRMFASRGRPERRLFPGALAAFLALIGVFTLNSRHIIIAYLLGLVAAYEMSLGLSGYSFRFLYEHVSFFQGFRAIARLGIFVVLFLAVLAAYGFAAITEGRRRVVQHVMLAIAVAVLMVEYSVTTLYLVPYRNGPLPVHAWLAQQPRGVVAELPIDAVGAGTVREAETMYYSTFHWQPIVNGYSGFAPDSYANRVEQVRRFPEPPSLEQLRRDNVRYLVVHLSQYARDEGTLVVQALRDHHRLPEVGRFDEPGGQAAVFLLK